MDQEVYENATLFYISFRHAALLLIVTTVSWLVSGYLVQKQWVVEHVMLSPRTRIDATMVQASTSIQLASLFPIANPESYSCQQYWPRPSDSNLSISSFWCNRGICPRATIGSSCHGMLRLTRRKQTHCQRYHSAPTTASSNLSQPSCRLFLLVSPYIGPGAASSTDMVLLHLDLPWYHIPLSLSPLYPGCSSAPLLSLNGRSFFIVWLVFSCLVSTAPELVIGVSDILLKLCLWLLRMIYSRFYDTFDALF